MDHTWNRLFSAGKKDTLRSIVGQLKYSGGNESNTQDEYFFSDENQTWISSWSCKSERKGGRHVAAHVRGQRSNSKDPRACREWRHR